MKKVLVTGAAGTIGINVIKFLLIEGKYEITALDLRNNKSFRRLKKYRERINIIYGDVADIILMRALIKDHDIVIHLAGVMPPFADIRDDICRIIDYEGTVNVVDSIVKNNKKCYLIYPSTTVLYGKCSDVVNVNDEVKVLKTDLYATYKLEAENYIKEKLNHYTIYRIPGLLCDLKKENPMYNTPINSKVELIGVNDVAYALVKSIDFKNKINKNTYILSGGKNCRIKFKNYLIKILKNYGISIRFLLSWFMVDKNFYGSYYEENELEDFLNYQQMTCKEYFDNLAKNKKMIRIVPRILAIPFILLLKRREK